VNLDSLLLRFFVFVYFCAFSFSLYSQQSNPGVEKNLENLARQSAGQGYSEEFIDLIEMIYGKGFLSQGGGEGVEHMLKDIPLENRSLLDIGSGLGGPALFLAEHYFLDITGLEPQEWLWKRAMQTLGEKEKLKGSLRFVLMDHPHNLSQFADEAFDIVMSKESLLHLPLECKKPFFAEIYRILKTGGELVIMDWMHSTPLYSKKTRKIMEMDGVAYHLMMPSHYQALLEESGFSQIARENVSWETACYSQENIDKIEELSSIIQEKYGKDAFEYCRESWGYQRDAFASEELIAGIFQAKKSVRN
jgi:phosphoethanolamine N-methyltransferase